MNRVTKIEVQKHHKDRVSIFLDEEYSFSISMETAMKYSLKKGMEIDSDKKELLIMESDKRIALDKSVHYMSESLKTKQQMIDYVKKHGFDDNIVEYVIQKLEEYGYINDKTYAEKYISTYLGSVGKKKIEYDLIKKGIDKDIISELLNEQETDIRAIVKLVEKKIGRHEKDTQTKQKVFRYLSGKGFSYDEIKRAVDIVFQGGDDESWN